METPIRGQGAPPLYPGCEVIGQLDVLPRVGEDERLGLQREALALRDGHLRSMAPDGVLDAGKPREVEMGNLAIGRWVKDCELIAEA